MTRRLAAILVLTCGLVMGADAMAGDYGRRIEGSVVKESTDKVLETVTWHRTIDAALSDAQKQKKPMLFLQMVGDLDGGL
ncbi:MAG: hypothetical protein AAF488_14020 [Planctomycetota bacterium]